MKARPKAAKKPDIDALIRRYEPRTTYGALGPRCRVAQTGEMTAAVIAGLRARHVTWHEVSRIIEAELGVAISKGAVARHYRGQCRCGHEGR